MRAIDVIVIISELVDPADFKFFCFFFRCKWIWTESLKKLICVALGLATRHFFTSLVTRVTSTRCVAEGYNYTPQQLCELMKFFSHND